MLDQSLPEARPAESRAVTAPLARPSRRARLLLVIIPILLILLAVGAIYTFNAVNQGKAFPGVKVGDLDLSGMNVAQAQAALTTRYGDVNANHAGVNLSYGDQHWQFAADEVGFRLDVENTVAAALAVGRSNNLFADLGQQWSALRSGVQLQPIWKYDQSNSSQLLTRLHQEIDRPVINASMSIGADGHITMNKSQVGRHVNDASTAANIAAALDSKASTSPTAQVVVSEQAPTISEADWESARAAATRAVLPITLRLGDNFEYVIGTAELAPMLILTPAANSQPATISLDNTQLTTLANNIATKVYQAPADAEFQIDSTNATASVKPEQQGQQLDVPATVAAISAADSNAQNRIVVLPTTTIEPAIHEADFSAVVNRANELMRGFSLNYKGGPWVIQGERMAVMLQLKRDDSSGKPSFHLEFDQAELARKLDVISKSTDRSFRDALYRLGADNRPYVATPAIDGRQMDVATTIAAINASLQAGGNDTDISFKVTPAPTYDLSQPLEFPDLLANAQTDLSKSSAPRRHNVTLGTNSFNNTLIPPGGIYSASDAFGPIDEDHGYQTGYAIVRIGGNISTQPAVGGGICQVATTFFQTAWWSGLPVVERYNHTYWISTYGVAPLGRKGLDATVFQYDVDLRMKNTTGHWLLVRSWVSQPDIQVHFQLYGTNPGWKVSVTNPIISNIVKTNATPVYENSDQLPQGTQVLVEHHQDGFDASISRTVTDGSGNVIDQVTLNSHYVPAYERYLVGTKPVPGRPQPGNAATPAPAAPTNPPTDAAGNPPASTEPQPTPAP